MTVDQLLERLAQQRRADGKRERQGEHRGEEPFVDRPPAPDQEEQRDDEGGDRQGGEAVDAEQAVGPELEGSQVMFVDGVDVAHRQQGQGQQGDDDEPGVQGPEIGDADQRPERRQHAEEEDERPEPDEQAEDHDAARQLEGRIERQQQPRQQQAQRYEDAGHGEHHEAEGALEQVKAVEDGEQQGGGVERDQQRAARPAGQQRAGQDEMQVHGERHEEPDGAVEDDGRAAEVAGRGEAGGEPQGGHVAEADQHQPALVARSQEDDRHAAHQPEDERQQAGSSAPPPAAAMAACPHRQCEDAAMTQHGHRADLAAVDPGEQLQVAVARKGAEVELADRQHPIARLQATRRGARSRSYDAPVAGAKREGRIFAGFDVRVVESRQEQHEREEDPEEILFFEGQLGALDHALRCRRPRRTACPWRVRSGHGVA